MTGMCGCGCGMTETGDRPEPIVAGASATLTARPDMSVIRGAGVVLAEHAVANA